MKAAIVTPCFLPVPAVHGGAVEVLITDILEGNEKEHRFDFDVYTIPAKELDGIKYRYSHLVQMKYPIGVRLRCRMKNLRYRIQGSSRRSAYLYEYICRLLNQEDYAFILVENNMLLYREIYQSTKYKDCLLFHMHNDVDEDGKSPELCRVVGSTAKGIFTVSDYLKKRICEVSPNNRTTVLYNCVDSRLFAPSAQMRENVRASIGFSQKEMVFFYSGRLHETKGVKELVSAFCGLCERYDNVRLLVAGGSWDEKIQQNDYAMEIAELSRRVGDKIRFTGFVSPDRMPEFYAAADVMVIPSRWEEPLGVVALEGMAMGLPVIATKSGGLVECLDDSCAILVENDDLIEQNLKRAMEQMLLDLEMREEKGRQGRERFKRKVEFHKENYFNGLCTLIEEALQE